MAKRKYSEDGESASKEKSFREKINDLEERLEEAQRLYPELKKRDNESVEEYVSRSRPVLYSHIMQLAVTGDMSALRMMVGLEGERIKAEAELMSFLAKKDGKLLPNLNSGSRIGQGIQNLLDGTTKIVGANNV